MPTAVRRYIAQEFKTLILKIKVVTVNPQQIKITYTTYQCENVNIIYTFTHEEQQLNIKSLLPNIGVSIDFLADASVVINQVNFNYDLNIKTSGNITTINDINCNRLTLSGNSIFLKHNVTTVHRCTLEYQQQLENHGKLAVTRSSLEFIASRGAKCSNFGTIDARGVIMFNIKNIHRWSRFINYGLIFSKEDIFINVLGFYNFNSVLSKSKLTVTTKKIFNCGIIFAEQYAGFRYSHNFINELNSIIASNHELRLSGLDVSLKKERSTKDNNLLVNKGTIKTLGKLRLATNTIENNSLGLLLGEKILMTAGQLVNDGQIKGSQKIEVTLLSSIDGYWYNTKTGTVQTLDLDCCLQQLINEGKIEVQENFANLLRDLQNKLGGKMLSDAKMSLLGLKKLINDSLIQATEELFIDGESIEIGKEGKLVANKISIDSQNIITEGLISAGQLCQIKADFFDAHLGSKSVAVEELKMYIIDQLNNSGSIAANSITLTAKQLENNGDISGLHSAKISAFDRFKQTARASIISNLGQIKLLIGTALISGEIEAKLANVLQSNNHILINQDGTIKSDGIITFVGNDVTNSGTIKAGASLTVDAYHEVENTTTGTMQSPEVTVNTFKLKNAGKILASNKLSVKTSMLKNLYAALIESASKLELNSDQLQNAGSITAYTQLQLTILNCLENLGTGKIASLGQLILDTKVIIKNLRVIAAQELEILGGCNVENLGTIAATSGKLTVSDAKKLINSGEISSLKSIELTSISILQNLQTGTISAIAGLKVLADLLIENHGQLLAYDVCLDATESLLLNGEQHGHQLTANAPNIINNGITTADIVDFTADLVAIDGQINAGSLKIEARNYLHLLKNGEINCAHAAQLLSKAGFINLGKILSGGRLTIIANELFHTETASIDASGELFLQAINMYLNGEIKASQDLLIMVENKFTYKTANLKANGELVLTLHDGTQIRQDINTPGNLNLEFLAKDGTWYNEQQLISGNDITIDIPGFIFVNGRTSIDALIYAQQTLKIKAKQISIDKGALLANNLDLHSKYNIIVTENGAIAGIHGNLAATGSIEQYGKIEFLKNLAMMAKKAYSHQGSTTLVGGDLEVEVDQWILEGLTKVDGELNAKVIDFHLKQYANTLQVPVTYNGRVGQVMVSIQQPDVTNGGLQANKITLSCEKFTQLGGTIKSGVGGAYIEIKGDAFLEGLRTSHVWQGAISARGRNYAIVPVFVPAKIESDGDLTVIADGKLIGASIELKAVGVKQVAAKAGVNITEKYESYAPPEFVPDDDDDDWFGGLFSIAISAFASCFVGPAACSMMGIVNTTALAITSAAIGGAIGTALNGGKLEDIFKSAAIGAITAGAMDKLKINLPTAVKGQAMNAQVTQNVIRTTAAANNALKYGVQTGVKAIVTGKGDLDPISAISSGVAGFSGATIEDPLHKNLFESAIKTTTTTAAHGGKVLHHLMNSTAEVIGSHLGEQMGDKFASQIQEQRRKAEIKIKEDQYKLNSSPKSPTLEKTKHELKSSTNQEKEQLIVQQKQRLVQQIINNLHLQRYLQANLAGVNIDINQMEAIIIKKINSMDIKDLIKLEREFDFYRLQRNETRQFKVVNAIFENELPKGSNVPTEEDKSFWERLIENYVKLNIEEIEVDMAMHRAQAEENLRLWQEHRVGTRAVGGLQILGASAQIGAAGILMETGVGVVPGSLMLFRGIDNLVAGVNILVSGEHTDTILHQAAQQVGFSSDVATLVEIGTDLGLGIAGNLSFKLLRDLKALDLAKPSKPLTLQHDIQKLSLKNISSSANVNYQANWNFSSRLTEQLQDPRLGSLAGKINLEKILELAHNPKANFFLDKNTGHVNVIQKVNEIPNKFLRITIIRDEKKIISVGVVRETSLLQYTNNSARYIEIGAKKITEQVKGPGIKNE